MKNIISTFMMIAFLAGHCLAETPERCATAKLEWSQNLNFNLSQSIGIQLSDIEGDFTVRLTSEGGYIHEFPLESDFIEIKHLLKTDNYTVILQSDCHAFTVYPNPRSEDDNNIYLSNSLYNAVADWSISEESENLLNYVVTLDDESSFERRYFLQEFFFDGLLPDEYIDDINGVIDPPDISKPCKCKMVLSAQTLMLPGTNVLGNMFPAIVDEGECWDCQGVKDYWTYDAEITGPAKYERLYSRAANMGAREISSNDVNTVQSPNRAYIRYNYVCSTGDGFRSECGCVKDIHLQYHYNTRLFNHTRLVNVAGDEDASATVQDMAAVLVAPHRNLDQLDVLAAGDAAIESACDAKINKDWLKSALDLSLSLVEIVTTVQGDDIDWDKLVEAAEKLKDRVNDLIGTPIRHASRCESMTQDQQLFNGNRVIQLVANKPVDVIVISRSFMKQRGSGGWQIKSKVHSDFSLIGVIREGFGTPEEEHCCFPYVASYALASSSGSIYSLANCQQFAESYANLIFPSYQLQCGKHHETINQKVVPGACPSAKGDQPKRDDRNSLRSSEIINNSYLELLDSYGRVLTSGTREALMRYEPNHSGIYFIRSHHKVEKIFLHKF